MNNNIINSNSGTNISNDKDLLQKPSKTAKNPSKVHIKNTCNKSNAKTSVKSSKPVKANVKVNVNSIKRIDEGKLGIINYDQYFNTRLRLIENNSLYQNKFLKRVSIYKNIYKEPLNVAEIHGFILKSIAIDDNIFYITKVVVSNGQSVFIKIKKNNIKLTVGQEVHLLCKIDTYFNNGIYLMIYTPYKKLPCLATFKAYNALYPSRVYFTGLITNKNFEKKGEYVRGVLIVSQVIKNNTSQTSNTVSILRFPCILLEVSNKFNYKVGDTITLQGEPFYDICSRKLREIGLHLLTCKKA